MKWITILTIGILLAGDYFVEPKQHHYHHGHSKARPGPLKRMFHAIKRKVSAVVRKVVDMPPKNRSRFDKYPIYVMRYHQFIWHRFFKNYLEHVEDERPKLPRVKCWSIKCWVRRNSFKRYWKRRAQIKIDGKDSPPFLHRRCRIPGTHGEMCVKEHLRHDYYWRMFMWIGRYGFPKSPPRKLVCVTDYCRHRQAIWRHYWNNFWRYTSLVPAIRPYDFNWKFWVWRHKGNIMRLQQIASPALMAMGLGGTMMMGGHMGVMMMNGVRNFMTIEMKTALMAVMQRNLAESARLASTTQYSLQRQQMALMILMRMPAFPSATAAQIQMNNMMQNMRYQQSMQQYQTQQMMQHQLWGLARYLRGSCGCNVCSAGGMHYGGMPTGASMYVRQHGMISAVNPGMMARQMTGLGGTNSMMVGVGGIAGAGALQMPVTPVRNPMELNMRVQALYAKNNLPIHY